LRVNKCCYKEVHCAGMRSIECSSNVPVNTRERRLCVCVCVYGQVYGGGSTAELARDSSCEWTVDNNVSLSVWSVLLLQLLQASWLCPGLSLCRRSTSNTTTTTQWLKWFCEAGGGAHLTKPGWTKPHTHSNPTNLALFRHKITLYRFNQGVGAHTIAGGSNGAGG